jgi:ATP-dependent RNA helicase DDX5/DBP2
MAGGLTVNKDIRQEIEVLDGNHEKYDALIQVLTKCCQDRPQKIIIFCQTKRGVDELEKNLRSD